MLPSLTTAVDEPGTRRPLPTPRSSPLKPGSRHETALIRFLDGGLLNVSRKYAKKYTSDGYYHIQSVVSDLQKLVDLIWISASRKSFSARCILGQILIDVSLTASTISPANC